MIFFISGTEPFFLELRLRALREDFRSCHDPSGLAMSRLAPGSATIDDLHRLVRSASLLNPYSFVELSGFLTHPSIKTMEAALIDVLKSVQHEKETTLVLVERLPRSGMGKDRKTPWVSPKLIKAVLSLSKAEEFHPLTAPQQMKWISERAKEEGGFIEPSAATLLQTWGKNDLVRLSGEVKKLCAYTAGRPVTARDVAALCSPSLEDDIFAFSDALGRRQIGNAMRRMHRLLASGEHELYVLKMMIRHFRILTFLGRLKHLSSERLSAEIKLHPYVIKKNREQLRFFRGDELETMLKELERMDRQIKSTSIDPKVLLDLFVVHLHPAQA